MKFENQYKPKFSVIVPVYNTAPYLEKCLKSVQAQTDSDFECILVDDGSVDRSGAICDGKCAEDERFRVLHLENGGAGRARNAGLDAAQGEWITFCDSDDWMEPNRLESVLRAARESGLPYVWSPMKIWRDGRLVEHWHAGLKGEYTTGDGIVLSSRKYDIGHTPNKAYHADLIKDIRFPEGLSMSEDLIFNIEAFYRAGAVYNDGIPTYNYTYRPGSLAHSRHSKDDFIKLYSEFLKLERRLCGNADFRRNFPATEKFVKGVIRI